MCFTNSTQFTSSANKFGFVSLKIADVNQEIDTIANEGRLRNQQKLIFDLNIRNHLRNFDEFSSISIPMSEEGNKNLSFISFKANVYIYGNLG